MNEDQWESIADLLAAATEPLTPKKRRAVLKRIREESVLNPRLAFLEGNIWNRIDQTMFS